MSLANGPSSPASCIGFTPLTDETGTGNGTEERGVTGGETTLAEANTRATLAEARLSDFKSMLDDIREQRDRWQQQANGWWHSRSRISGMNPHPRSLSRGGECSEPPLGSSCFYGLWASSVEAFCFQLFVNRVLTQLELERFATDTELLTSPRAAPASTSAAFSEQCNGDRCRFVPNTDSAAVGALAEPPGSPGRSRLTNAWGAKPPSGRGLDLL
jgi:hypothetical protein